MLRGGNRLAAKLIGADTRIEDYLAAHPNRATQVTLAIALAGIEDQTSRETWRYPKPLTARYLLILGQWGYALSPVERIAAML